MDNRSVLRSARPVALMAAVMAFWLLAACGDSGGVAATQRPATTEPVELTTTIAVQAQRAPRTSPPPKPASTTTTTTTLPVPAGFPDDLPLPAGEVGYYTGSPVLGFHLNISTGESFSDLVRAITDGIEQEVAWNISVRNVGQGYLPGYDGLWAIYTANDHVLTQVAGDYTGVIEIEGRHINFLLDPLEQPPNDVEPDLLPPPEELPRPDTSIVGINYSAGLVRMIYNREPATFESLLAAYRDRGWTELGASSSIAVGELDGWKITFEDLPEGLAQLLMDFENLALSYP